MIEGSKIFEDNTEEDHKCTNIPYSEDLQQGRCTKRFLNVSDFCLSLFVISPLVIIHWRGTWAFMDYEGSLFPPWNCFIFGMILHLTIALMREFIYAKCKASKKTKRTMSGIIFRYVFTKMHAYIFSIGCNMHWRGGWAVIDGIIGIGWTPAILLMVICFLGLICFKSLRNVLAPPVILLTDSKEFAYAFPTRFRMEGSQDPLLYILDCVFSVLVIGTLVVFVWRGMWVLCDLIIYPDDETMTAWGSLAIGYGIVAVTFALQSLMRWACDRLQGFWRVAVADIFLFFSFIGTVNVWRGVWQICDVYFFPENKQLGNILTHVISFLLLALLNCSNSVLVRGVYIDAEEPAGQCVIFPVYYIRLFFQKERTKKQKKLLDALEKLDPHHHNHHHHNNQTGALLTSSEKENTKIIIVPSNNKNSNAAINNKKAIELNAILNDVENINEKQKNLERTILRSNDD